MNYDEYKLELFSGLKSYDMSDEEKLKEINKTFEVFNMDEEEEKAKFDKMGIEGKDMKTVASVFGGVLVNSLNHIGIDDFYDLKLLPEAMKSARGE